MIAAVADSFWFPIVSQCTCKTLSLETNQIGHICSDSFSCVYFPLNVICVLIISTLNTGE